MEREVQRGAQRGVGRTSRGVHGGLCGEFHGGFCRWVNRMLCGGMQSWGNIGSFSIL